MTLPGLPPLSVWPTGPCGLSPGLLDLPPFCLDLPTGPSHGLECTPQTLAHSSAPLVRPISALFHSTSCAQLWAPVNPCHFLLFPHNTCHLLFAYHFPIYYLFFFPPLLPFCCCYLNEHVEDITDPLQVIFYPFVQYKKLTISCSCP